MPEFDSAFHRIHVTDNDGVRLMRFERNHQSNMRLDDPFETDIEYVGYLHLTLAVCPQATRALVVGLGGGSLVKRMWRDYPWMHVDAVELDSQVIEICRAYFALPDDERLRVVCEEGRAFVESCEERYGIIAIDAFNDDRIPLPLITEEFLLACKAILEPDGVLAYNVIGSVYGQYSKPFRSLHRTLSNVWRHVWTFPIGIADDVADKTRNIVVLASDADMTDDELLDRIGDRVGGIVTVPAFERFAEDLYTKGIRSGDVAILTDPAPRRRR